MVCVFAVQRQTRSQVIFNLLPIIDIMYFGMENCLDDSYSLPYFHTPIMDAIASINRDLVVS